MEFTAGLPNLALVGVDDVELFESLQTPLAKVARLLHRTAEQIIDTGFKLDGVILVVGPTPGVSVAPLPRFRKTHPRKPIFVAWDKFTVNEAVEMMLVGATDIFTLPVDAPVLKAKLEREFCGVVGPAIEAPILKPFAPEQVNSLALPPPQRPFNRLSAPRADVPPQLSAKALLKKGKGEGQASLLDFSISMQGKPGGARVQCDAASAASLGVASWTGKTALTLSFDLPGSGPIAAHADVIPPIRRLNNEGAVAFAIQYTLDDVAQAGDARRFWSACRNRSNRPTHAWVVPTL